MADSSTTSERPIDEAARRRFEAAWRAGKPAPVEQFLPAAGDPAFLGTLEELVLIDLEFAWKARRAGGAKEPPRLESYLIRFPQLDQPAALRRLVREEYRLRRDAGDTPVLDEYKERFPSVVVGGTDEFTIPQAVMPAGVVTRLQAGDRLGRYRLGGEHARGGFGLVWRAADDELGREVAVKQLSSRLADEPVHRRRFLAEARIAAQLQHPGVVPVYDLGGADSPHPFYAMKLVRGQTFAEAIKAYHADPDAAGGRAVNFLRLLNAFLAVVRAMAFAHSRGVIHRDLKPANIVLGDYGETVILDWGLAKVVGESADGGPDVTPTPLPAAADNSAEATQVGTVVGTPAYMAPEQARGDLDDVDQRSDVYALGAILYQLLTGRMPYEGSTPAVLRQVAAGEPPTRPRSVDATVPAPLEAVCLKAMVASPARRYQTAADLARDVERFLADEPVAAHPEPTRDRLARWARRHTTAVAAALVAIVVALIGGAVGFVAWDRVEQQRARANDDRLAALRNAAATDEGLALAALHDSRFSEATTLFDKAVGHLGDESEFAHLRPALVARRDRAGRVAEFYRAAERAELLAFWDRDVAALAACELGLRQLGVLEPVGQWWERLPLDDLSVAQRIRLQDDANHMLMLAGGLRTKRAGNQLGTPAAAEAFRAALATLPPTQAYHEWRWGQPAYSGRVLELMGRYFLNDRTGLPTLGPPDPISPTDCYFTGFVLLAAGMLPPEVLSLVLPTDLRKHLPLDLAAMRPRAEELFRKATTLDPQNYWSHLWLGYALRGANKFAEAEQSYNACLALRPDSPLARTLRAESVLARLGTVKDAGRLRSDCEQARADLDRSLAADPDDPLAHWLHAQALGVLGEFPAAVASAARSLDLEIPPPPPPPALSSILMSAVGALSRSGTEKEGSSFAGLLQTVSVGIWSGGSRTRAAHVIGWAEQVEKRIPDDPDAAALVAQAHLFGRNAAAALAAADRALGKAPRHVRARAIRGGALLATGKHREAVAELTTALADGPRDYLAGAGIARAYEAAGEFDRALAAFDALLAIPSGGRPLAVVNWQELEVHLGRARTLTKLGRRDEAAKALAVARVIDPAVSLTTRTGLFP